MAVNSNSSLSGSILLRGESNERLERQRLSPRVSTKGSPWLGEWGDLIATVCLPWLCFTFIVAMFVYGYEDYSQLAWVLAAFCALLGFAFLVLGAAFSDGRGAHLCLGFVILGSVVIAVPVGFKIEQRHLQQYWLMENGASYRQVEPSDPGNVRSDASILEFADGTFVDVQKTVGYMKRGTVYCAAPVSGLQQSQRPSYWAVGTNCCGERGDFECGSVYHEHAKTGVVLAEEDTGNYATAVRMAQSVYGLETSPPVFLHWTNDVEAYKTQEYRSAANMVLVACLVHIACSSLAACIYVWRFRGAQSNERQTLNAKSTLMSRRS